MLGFYQIYIKNTTTGTDIKWDVLVMENLFYDRKTTRIFDLKGSMRNRYTHATGDQNEVLLDENMVEFIYESPLFVREHSKKLLRASLWNDTLFLSRQNVMDYSLMIGIDEAKKELVVGIIGRCPPFFFLTRSAPSFLHLLVLSFLLFSPLAFYFHSAFFLFVLTLRPTKTASGPSLGIRNLRAGSRRRDSPGVEGRSQQSPAPENTSIDSARQCKDMSSKRRGKPPFVSCPPNRPPTFCIIECKAPTSAALFFPPSTPQTVIHHAIPVKYRISRQLEKQG